MYFLFILFPIELYSVISRSWSSFYLCKTVNLDVHFLYWSGQRSLVAAHWLSSTFDRESFLAWWGLIFIFFFRFHIFLVLLSTTLPNTPKKSTFRPLKNDAGKSTVMYCPSFWGTPSSLFRGELLNFGGVSEYPLLFGGVKLCLFWGAKFCRGSREYVVWHLELATKNTACQGTVRSDAWFIVQVGLLRLEDCKEKILKLY